MGVWDELCGDATPEYDIPAGTDLSALLIVPVKQPDQTVIGVLYTGKGGSGGEKPGSVSFMEEDLHKVVCLKLEACTALGGDQPLNV